MVVRFHGVEGGEAEGGVGARVVPPGAADAVFVVRVALDQVGGGHGAVADQLLWIRVPRQGDDDVARGQAGGDDVGLQGHGQVLGFGLQGGTRGDEGAVGGEEGEGREVLLHEGERVRDVLLVRGFDGAEAVVDVADLDDLRVERAGRTELFEHARRLPHGCLHDGGDGLAELGGHVEQRGKGRQGLEKVAEGLGLFLLRIDGFDDLAYGAAGGQVGIRDRFVYRFEPLPYGKDRVEGVSLLRGVSTEVFGIVAHVRSRGVTLLLYHSY